MDEKLIKRVPLKNLTSVAGKDLVQIYHNFWWVVDDEDNALFFRGSSPQCNQRQSIAESIRDRLYPGYEVRLVEVAFLPIRSNDFDHSF